MELIKNWLSGNRNYTVGAVLYNKIGNDDALKKLFAQPADAYRQQRLVEALQKLLEKPAPVITPSTEAGEMPDAKDPVLKALRKEWQSPYQRMKYLQHELDTIEGNSDEAIARRKPIAFEILELEQQCIAVWERRRYYEKNGRLPEVKQAKEELPKDPVELGRKIETIKRNIRRNKLLAEKNPAAAKYAQLQKQYEQELSDILKTVNDAKAAGE